MATSRAAASKKFRVLPPSYVPPDIITQEAQEKLGDQQTSQQRTVILEVGPAQALAFLQGNTGNRPLSPQRVEFFANAIERGERRLTHQGVAIACDGRLLDGQTRLAAIVKAGRAIRLPVSFNVDAGGFRAMDIGAKRSASYILGRNTSFIATVRLMLSIEAGSRRSAAEMWSIEQVDRGIIRFGPYIERLVEATARTVRLKTSAPVQATFGCRIIQAEYKGLSSQPVADAYRAFVLADYENMPPGLLALTRQLEGLQGMRRQIYELCARAWTATEPGRRDIKILVINPDNQLKQMQRLLQSVPSA